MCPCGRMKSSINRMLHTRPWLIMLQYYISCAGTNRIYSNKMQFVSWQKLTTYILHANDNICQTEALYWTVSVSLSISRYGTVLHTIELLLDLRAAAYFTILAEYWCTNRRVLYFGSFYCVCVCLDFILKLYLPFRLKKVILFDKWSFLDRCIVPNIIWLECAMLCSTNPYMNQATGQIHNLHTVLVGVWTISVSFHFVIGFI